jgi:hypothetical protein
MQLLVSWRVERRIRYGVMMALWPWARKEKAELPERYDRIDKTVGKIQNPAIIFLRGMVLLLRVPSIAQ